jgi:hypothetical protein
MIECGLKMLRDPEQRVRWYLLPPFFFCRVLDAHVVLASCLLRTGFSIRVTV